MRRRLTTLAVVVLSVTLAASACSDDGESDAAASQTPSTSSTPSSTAPTSASPFPTYVALGDSYTAAPFVPTTDQAGGCLRSDGNYPALVAAAVGSTLDDVSCSGATTTSLVGVQQTAGSVHPAQFDALQDDTSLVTLGIGGNDGNLFATLVQTCAQAASTDPTGHPCEDQLGGLGASGQVAGTLQQTRGLVTAAVRGVHDRSPDATVLVVGYPQLVPSTGTCAALPLAAGDYAFMRDVLVRLNQALQTAARRGDATYVDVAAASRGHDICAGDQAWVNGSTTDPSRALAFHPFAIEQQAVAGLIEQALGAA